MVLASPCPLTLLHYIVSLKKVILANCFTDWYLLLIYPTKTISWPHYMMIIIKQAYRFPCLFCPLLPNLVLAHGHMNTYPCSSVQHSASFCSATWFPIVCLQHLHKHCFIAFLSFSSSPSTSSVYPQHMYPSTPQHMFFTYNITHLLSTLADCLEKHEEVSP